MPLLRRRTDDQVVDGGRAALHYALPLRIERRVIWERPAFRQLEVHHLLPRGQCQVDAEPLRLHRKHPRRAVPERRKVVSIQRWRSREGLQGGNRGRERGVHRGAHGQGAFFRAAAKRLALLLDERVSDRDREDHHRREERQRKHQQVSAQRHAYLRAGSHHTRSIPPPAPLI